MKFYKTKRGHWINPAHVRYFSTDNDGNAYAVFGDVFNSDGGWSNRDEISIGKFDSRAEAKSYLKEFVDKFNEEDKEDEEDDD